MRLILRLNGDCVRAFHVALAERLSLLPGVELTVDARPAGGGVPSGAEALFQLETLIHRLPADGTARRVPLSALAGVGSSRVDLQACKLEYSIVSPK